MCSLAELKHIISSKHCGGKGIKWRWSETNVKGGRRMEKRDSYFVTWKIQALLPEDGGVDCPPVCHIHCLPTLLSRLLWRTVLPECEGAAGGKEGVDHHQPSWWRGHVLWPNHPGFGQEMWSVPALHVTRSILWFSVIGKWQAYLIIGREAGHTRKQELFKSCQLLGIPERWGWKI